jgi:2,4-dienoyl-CoA reductase-like NADH-dependent reductase (Old Yellow Enzyme family)
MSRANSVLFAPETIGHHTIKNRFMRSATNEYLATRDGTPRRELRDTIVSFAMNDVGLIVTGCMYIGNDGRRAFTQSGMCTPEQSKSWKSINDEVHKHGSKILFQLSHAGPSGNAKCNNGIPVGVPTSFHKRTRTLTKAEIGDVIEQFKNAAGHAYRSGADGVQLHAAHGYLLSCFLSPALNRRNDEYGGSFENRMRIVEEIVGEIRKSLPGSFLLSIKMNGDDCRKGGLTPYDAAKIVNKLQRSVDLFEISGGSSGMFSIRSNLDEKAVVKGAKKENREAILERSRKATKDSPFFENYNLASCKIIRELNPTAKLALVGGLRKFTEMEKIVNSGTANLCSLSRPFIKDSSLVKRFRVGTIDEPTCTNCGSCILNLEGGMFCHTK